MDRRGGSIKRGDTIAPIVSFIVETLAAFAAVILALNVAAALILAVYLCRPRKKTYLDDYVFTPFETGVDFEPVSFRTADGVLIAGWWLFGRGNRVVVGLTGRSGIKSDLLGVGSCLAKAGFHVLLTDFRGRGQSAPAAMGLGRQEEADAVAAVEYAAARLPNARIGIIGFSVGATVAIGAAARNGRVLSLAADCPFCEPGALMRAGMRRFFPITRALFIPVLTRIWSMALFGFDLGKTDILASAGRLRLRRALVVVAGKDSVIPPAQQRVVYDAVGAPKELWEEPDVDHCGAYFADRARYVTRIVDFFTNTLGSP